LRLLIWMFSLHSLARKMVWIFKLDPNLIPSRHPAQFLSHESDPAFIRCFSLLKQFFLQSCRVGEGSSHLRHFCAALFLVRMKHLLRRALCGTAMSDKGKTIYLGQNTCWMSPSLFSMCFLFIYFRKTLSYLMHLPNLQSLSQLGCFNTIKSKSSSLILL